MLYTCTSNRPVRSWTHRYTRRSCQSTMNGPNHSLCAENCVMLLTILIKSSIFGGGCDAQWMAQLNGPLHYLLGPALECLRGYHASRCCWSTHVCNKAGSSAERKRPIGARTSVVPMTNPVAWRTSAARLGAAPFTKLHTSTLVTTKSSMLLCKRRFR